jgi:outer membrane protein assembly factor BamB
VSTTDRPVAGSRPIAKERQAGPGTVSNHNNVVAVENLEENRISGKQKWRFKTGDDSAIHNQVGIQSSAAVMDGIVYFGCRDSHLYALDAITGQKKWAFPTNGSWVITSPAIRNGKIYFATSDSGLLYELDAKTGYIVFFLNFQAWPTFSSPAIAGDMLYVGSTSRRLNAIDLANTVRRLRGFSKPMLLDRMVQPSRNPMELRTITPLSLRTSTTI